MSGVAVVRYLLANDSGILGSVPATRIFAGVIPLNTVLPAIAVQQISGTPRNTLAMTEAGAMQTERVQVTVQAKSYSTQKAILKLALAACPNQRGTVNSVKLESIVPDGEGPDDFDDAAVIYGQTRDFLVRWRL